MGRCIVCWAAVLWALGAWLICGCAACGSDGDHTTHGASGASAANASGAAAISGSGPSEAGGAGNGTAGTSVQPGSRGSAAGASSGGSGRGTGGGAIAGGAGMSGNAGSSSGDRSSTGGAGGGAQVGLAPGVTAFFPAPQSNGVCPDPPLRISFAGAPTLGASGKIQVFSQSGSMVASVDMAATSITDMIGGTSFMLPRTAFVDGNDAVVYLKHNALSYGQSYYVTVDSGAIRAPGGAAFAINDKTTWRFSTAQAAPSDLSMLSVALDGSGSFCSVQGALDALPTNGTATARITINAGRYHEIIHMRGKSNVTLHGQDRKQTVILGTNNNNLNPSTSTRALVGFDDSHGLVVENLTIHNLTPQGGSQAEALRIQGCDKCIVRNADIVSLQDTLLWSGRIYADHCYIEGNVDYIWGTGVAYFNQCEIRTVGRSGVLVQARNPAGAYGYVFVDSKLTADGAATSNMLARIDVSVYPGSHVAYINCQMTNIAAAGWTITGGSASSSLRFWEYQSTDASGNPLNVSGRVSGSSQASSSQAATMRDPSSVLGGWQPAP
jgi:hypothetical protein